MTFTVVSTFSGTGGSCQGYKMAGANILLAVEFEKNAVDSYKSNFPNTQVFFGDIASLSSQRVMELTGLEPGQLDLFDGSPPCQGFSTTGKRKLEDSRNQLFKEYVRLLNDLQPKVFVMENVSGMIKGNMKFIFVEILKSLKECGYKVKAKLLNAKYYGVPQSRQRMIFIGVRNDIPFEPSYPEPSTKLITLRQALVNCPQGERKPAKGFVATVIDRMKQGETAAKYHPKKHYFGNVRTSWDKPCPTIIKTCASLFFHPDLNESLSIQELKRLSTFPDDFVLQGKFEQQWARIGNAVPPKLMQKIAEHLYENIIKPYSLMEKEVVNE